MIGTAGPAQTLAQAKRQATVDRILAAALHLLMARGLDITMDEIAAEAGVGRRTVFRHFESRERLLADAFEFGIQRYGDRLPSFEGDWRSWLRHLCRSTHQMQASYGPGYWELTSRTDLPPELAVVEARRRRQRRDAMSRIAGRLWHEAGGPGDPPAQVVAAVGAHLSARFTAAVLADVGQPWTRAAELACEAIVSAVEKAAA